MSHGTEQHLEHAEHAQHAVHDPFNRLVAMTMAIVAAVLAGVTMMSHREHNDTLRLQTEANIHHVKASDQWSYYQAKKNRQYLYEAAADVLGVIPKDATNTQAAEKMNKLAADWKQKKIDKYKEESEEIQKKAKEEVEEANLLQKESEHAHHRADRYDWGELGVELALVLCSIAILTKSRPFWYSGIGFGLLGLGVALSALLLH